MLKNEDSKYVHKFLIYDKVTMDEGDNTIINCVRKAKEMFVGTPDEIKVKCVMDASGMYIPLPTKYRDE